MTVRGYLWSLFAGSQVIHYSSRGGYVDSLQLMLCGVHANIVGITRNTPAHVRSMHTWSFVVSWMTIDVGTSMAREALTIETCRTAIWTTWMRRGNYWESEKLLPHSWCRNSEGMNEKGKFTLDLCGFVNIDLVRRVAVGYLISQYVYLSVHNYNYFTDEKFMTILWWAYKETWICILTRLW